MYTTRYFNSRLRNFRTMRRRYRKNRAKAGPMVGGYQPYRYVAPIIPRGLKLRVHSFKQTYHPSAANLATDANCAYTAGGGGAFGSGVLSGPATGSVAPAGYFSLKFTANDLPQYASFSALFDCYKINKVVVKLIPVVTNYNVPGNTAGNVAAEPQWLSTVIDYDDATLLTTEGSLLEYETFKQSRPGRAHKRVFTPKIAMDAYRTGGTTIGFIQKSMRENYIDAAFGDTEGYGLKGLINGPALLADQIQGAWKVYVTMYITFKQTR